MHVTQTSRDAHLSTGHAVELNRGRCSNVLSADTDTGVVVVRKSFTRVKVFISIFVSEGRRWVTRSSTTIQVL